MDPTIVVVLVVVVLDVGLVFRLWCRGTDTQSQVDTDTLHGLLHVEPPN